MPSPAVMPGLVPGIHVFLVISKQDVDGRDKPGHDGMNDRRDRIYCAASLVSSASLRSASGCGMAMML